MFFYVGAYVALKSGGPLMTVWGIRPNGTIVDVVWFQNGELHRDAFDQTELDLYQKVVSG